MLENENFEEKKNVRKKLLMTIALVVITVALGVGGVYAYFAAGVSQDTTSGISISAVSGLKISFSNSNTISMPNALPGQSFTKTFSATLTNKKLAITTNYSIYIKATTNGFNEQTGKLTYTLKKNGEVVKNNIEITGTGPIPIYTTSITGNTDNDTVTDSYELTITYPNNETSVQKQGATFNGSVYFGVADADNKIDSESVQTAKEITFTIGDTEYHALEGMTWTQFVESDYNINNVFYISEGFIMNSADDCSRLRVCFGGVGWYEFFSVDLGIFEKDSYSWDLTLCNQVWY